MKPRVFIGSSTEGLPIAYALRATPLYQRVIVVYGSAAIALVALVWLVERAFNLRLPGF